MAVCERIAISLTYGGEALSLAACKATLREYRERDVIGHLRTMGQRLTDGLNAAAAELEVPLRVFSYPACAAMRLDVPREEMDQTWFAFLAACARRGVLLRRGGLNNITYSHQPADIEQTVDACRAALRDVKDQGLARRTGGHSEAGSQQVGIPGR
jgi:glutamate-1-semialdehyde aminotransferase